MNYCTKCGNKLVENDSFCTACGNNVKQPHSENSRFTQNNMPSQSVIPYQGGMPQMGESMQSNTQKKRILLSPDKQKQPRHNNNRGGMSRSTLLIIIVIAILLIGGINIYFLTRKPGEVEVPRADPIALEDSETPGEVSGTTPGVSPSTSGMPAARVGKLNATVKPVIHLAPQAGNYYYPSNLLDGDKNTAWIVNSNEAWGTHGIDLLEFSLNAHKIDHVLLTNGYSKNQKVFINNARASSVVISRMPASVAGPTDIIYDGPLQDTLEPQYLPVSSRYDNSRPTNKIYVWFPSIINGTKYPYDFCISEIQFFGQ